MTRDKLNGFGSAAIFVTLIGLVLLFFSTNFGMARADSWLAGRGSADTDTYLLMVEGNINAFLVGGGVLSGIGFAGMAFVYYKMLSLKTEE